MWRYIAGGVAALLLVAAGWVLIGAPKRTAAALPSPPSAAGETPAEETSLPASAPEASPKSREEKRFGRYDKDKDGAITREEYLASRRKAYAKLDTDRDGRLSFEEWAAKTTTKFVTADRDRSGSMSAAEFATTAVKRTARPRCACPPQAARDED